MCTVCDIIVAKVGKMEYQEILVKQYTSYIESKDRFVERTFLTNRFYLLLTCVLVVATAAAIEFYGDNVSYITIALSFCGLAVSFLWLLNQDSYLYLIKAKLADVIEKFESHLPFQPHILEFEGIKERGKKMRVVFPEAQKMFAFVSFLLFFAVFVCNAGVKIITFFSSH